MLKCFHVSPLFLPVVIKVVTWYVGSVIAGSVPIKFHSPRQSPLGLGILNQANFEGTKLRVKATLEPQPLADKWPEKVSASLLTNLLLKIIHYYRWKRKLLKLVKLTRKPTIKHLINMFVRNINKNRLVNGLIVQLWDAEVPQSHISVRDRCRKMSKVVFPWNIDSLSLSCCSLP